MNVQIVSIQAAIHGRPSILWHGEVELPEQAHPINDGITEQEVNEFLFRYFNRVDEEDGDRLAEIGFELPSLSVGDLIHWASTTWRVAGMGFEKITGSDEYVMALTAYTLRTASEEGEQG
jgi:hypothetical protein